VRVYGLLRWANTVAMWTVGLLTVERYSSNDWANLTGGLILFGTLILVLSIAHLAGSLGEFRVRPTPEQPTLEQPQLSPPNL
jgi:hypothetical protein